MLITKTANTITNTCVRFSPKTIRARNPRGAVTWSGAAAIFRGCQFFYNSFIAPFFNLAKDAARGGGCFFGVCGANLPSHGMRGNEMVWCSSMNERKDPGPQKTKPVVRRDEKIASLEFYMNLLLSDMRTVCDVVPGLSSFMTKLVQLRQTGKEESAPLQETLNPWTQMGAKQVCLLRGC